MKLTFPSARTDLGFDFDRLSQAVDTVHRHTALFTSAHIVASLLDRLGWPRPGARLLDPAAGDGAFLVQALNRLALGHEDTDALSAVQGWEFHPGAVRAARARIEAALIDRGWSSRAAHRGAEQTVVERDFLTEGPARGSFDIIAANPPYMRWTAVPDALQDSYAPVLNAYARADLLHAFIDRCCELLPDGGIIGIIASDRFLLNENAAGLREAVGKRFGLAHVGRIDAASSFYRPKYRVAGSPPRVHPVEIVLRAGAGHRRLTREPISPDGEDEVQEASGRCLGDIATVRLAPWLGAFGRFVLDAATAKGLAGAELVPAIDTDDLDPATDVLRPATRFAIVTRPNAEPMGAVAEHLRASLHLAPASRRHLAWWLPPERITLPLDKPCLVVPRIARRLRAIEVPAGVLCINHNLTICAPNAGGMSLDALKTILLSERSQRWIARQASRLEGGYLSITTRMLRRLPVD